MRNKIVFCITFVFLVACSHVTDGKKVNNEVNKLALTWYQLAEKNRLKHQLSKALKYYELSYEFALKKNNIRLQLFILTRQALVLSQQGKNTQSLVKLNAAKKLLEYEISEATEEFNILQIPILKYLGQHEQALELHNLNKAFFKTEEQKIYSKWLYQELESELDPQNLSSQMFNSADNDFNFLYNQYRENKLKNIEILTYVGIQYLKILADKQHPKLKKVSSEMLHFFSEQENPAKTAQCYKIVSGYYVLIGEPEKAEYYSEKAQKIENILLN